MIDRVRTLSLDGAWTLHAADGETFSATVPGSVHTDLMAAKRIPDPYVGDHERKVQWVGEQDWTYRCTFDLPEDIASSSRIRLCANGLDTLATVRLNGEDLAEVDNMYRQWRWEVADRLQPGENTLEVAFASPLPRMAERTAERALPEWRGPLEPDGRGYIRKAPATFGWDWGPVLITQGIWRSIWLEAVPVARLADVHVRQSHHEDRVELAISVQSETTHDVDLAIQCSVTREGVQVASSSVQSADGTFELTIPSPDLWWPNGLGEQPLYDVRVELVATEGVVDVWERQIGLRQFRLVRQPDAWGESFHFEVNSVPFFAKGANWIPADALVTRVTPENTEQLLQSAADAHMNMIRVWGGGVYETDAFYETCDRLGLCVWQDFMFACSTYPTDDAGFMDSVRAEAEDAVRRLRHHVSLTLWCGNNEIEQGLVGEGWTAEHMDLADYDLLFSTLLPDVVTALDPDTDYWPGSPHSPGNRPEFNDPTRGDAHLWDVWHGRQPFEWYRTAEHRFCSEFGFQSFPELRTVETYTQPEDRNVTSYVMELHQRSGAGNALILHYLLDWFRLPTSFPQILRLSQILQGLAIQYAVEHWRRSMPRGMGTLYWQLNDCWPVASWASIDYYGRWKALHHMARRFFAPVLVSGVEEGSRVTLHVTNDRRQRVVGDVVWTLTDLVGDVLRSGRQPVGAEPGANTEVGRLEFEHEIESHTERGLLLWIELEADGDVHARNLVHFARPKHLALRQPEIRATVEQVDATTHRIELVTDVPALWVGLEVVDAEVWVSDNVLHLRPDSPQTLELVSELSADEIRSRLLIQSLWDTYAT